ncbi:MAG: hypothetical protein HYX28_02095 [Candidatus Koribacter versatilis]|uniref:Tetratricopeptide repeat protein n=1 Tax=Candidatus Korobacter versatilis TaxID=658062 RepID=A0A932A6F4_9BACT|nr:hypothetical protein [Candidatus Koribacter versatilis]
MRNKTFSLLFVLALFAPLASAGRKEDLQRQAQQAAQARKLDEAAAAMCELAKLDSSKQPDCEAARQEATAESRRNDDRFNQGVAFFNQGTKDSLDDAEQRFKNIRFGPHYSEAQRYLTQSIPSKRAELNRPPDDTQTFNDGMQAYNRNDFGAAKTVFSQVKGSKAGEAQTYLSRIRQYESAMAEGDRLAANGNHRGAQQSYEEAGRLKGDGPGDPRGKAGREQVAVNLPAGPTPVAIQTAARTASQGETPAGTAPPPLQRQAAIKEPARPKVNIEKLLHEGYHARSEGNAAEAKSKYIAVLAEEPNNATARTALDQIAQEEQAKPQVGAQQAQATPEADIMLARAIGEYYKGNYTEAETHIKDYQNVNGSKKALGYFFSGVSKLTRYYLGGGNDKKLLNDAEAALRIAKGTQGFKAPGEEFVSPKILKIYSGL